MKNFEEILRKYRLIITIILVVLLSSLIATPFLFCRKMPLFDKTSSRFEVAECIAQIVASLFVTIGTFIAVLQYYISSRSEMARFEKENIIKGIDLAQYYKDNILKPYSVIRKVYKDAGIFDFLKREKDKMSAFDEEEMENIFSEKELKKLSEMYKSKEFLDSLVVTNEVLNLKLNGFSYDDAKKTGIIVEPNKVIADFQSNYIAMLLNNVELFAMYFSHNVADDSVVYQSLYPTYIELCQALYYDISRYSVKGGPKLYRNVQNLYIKWLEESNKSKEKLQKESVKMGSVSKKI